MIHKDIIRACRASDQEAFKKCYEACAPYVYAIVKNYIKDVDLRKDMMQDIFSQVFSSIHNYSSQKGSFKSWIAQISIHQCISHLRKSRRLSMFVPLDEELDVASIEDSFDLLTKEEIENLLELMPEGYRTVFLLKVIDEYSHKEIAKLLAISVGASRSQLSRAILWIQRNLSLETKKFIYGQ